MTAYHDLDTPQDMRSDAAAAGQVLLPSADGFTDLYAGFPSDRPKAHIEVSEAAQRLAAAIYQD
jgi:hypothetical protein